MPLRSLHRWFASVLPGGQNRPSAQRIESYPPLAWPSHRAWSSRIGRWLGANTWAPERSEWAPNSRRQASNEALAAARLEFADAIVDVRTAAAAEALDRIAVTRSLHELWHFRQEIFSLVSCRHDQAEAARRLASLDRHFPRRARPASFGPGPVLAARPLSAGKPGTRV
jgi:hypothetical protein